MLPKKERLSRNEFNRFFSAGKRIHTPLFTLVYTPCHELHTAVVVPKKCAPLAVVRNKIRRRVYESVRQYRKMHGFCGVCIFIVKKGIQEVTYPTLAKEVHAQLTLLGR